MKTRYFIAIIISVLIFSTSTACSKDMADMGTGSQWQENFDLAKCKLSTTGKNKYFVLEPGHQLILEGEDEKVQITVLDKTKMVDGITTRVVEEREWIDGELYEISLNYFAICEGSKDVFYFGEDVDYYKNGKVVKHDGAWLAGKDGNKAGLIMSGTPKEEMKYYQEIAPGVAMDRAEIVSLNETCKTPAGTFSNCLKIEEGSALSIMEKEYKYYAPGIGLIQDEDLVLTKHGVVTK
jgi:hypothetical protein